MLKLVLSVAVVPLVFTSLSAQNRSVYTSLSDAKCKTIESTDEEGGSYRGICPGVAGYKLELIEGDLRQSINVIDPNGEKHELNLWNVSGGFSSVGKNAEWRMNGKTPVAIILRFNVNEHPEAPSKTTSYLLVAKLNGIKTCITDALKPTRSQNAEARKAADTSAGKPCRT